MRLSFTFRGRASRSEYGIAYALLLALAVCIKVISFAPHAKLISGVLGVLLLIPITSASVRRLHDTNRSGSALWMSLIPIVGAIVVVTQLFERGSPGPNRYGPAPFRPVSEPTAAPQMMRRRHLDAEGILLGFEYLDEAGNVIATTGPNDT
jgi:uncharacterized membrane protein YhaH (DUF805 family)